MKFLVDAQLPRRLAAHLNQAGCDALHTLDLPNGNTTTDDVILLIAESEQRVVISKDADFVHSFHLDGKPEKLLVISTGNISNAALDELFLPNLPSIIAAFQYSSFIELTNSDLIIHI